MAEEARRVTAVMGGMMSKKIDKWSMDQSSSSSNLKPEVMSVKCSVCGTIYTIVTNTVGCFYCPT